MGELMRRFVEEADRGRGVEPAATGIPRAGIMQARGSLTLPAGEIPGLWAWGGWLLDANPSIEL
jgi:hypothetical protein